MQIPGLFKKAIADTFYDKVIDIYDVVEKYGEELDVRREKGNIIQSNLRCNVQQTSKDIVLKDYGLNIEANIIITCDEVKGEIGNIISYKNQDYTTTGKLVSDSHTTLFAKLGVIISG